MVPRWLPGAMQDFAQWMRPRALKVMDWKPLLKSSTRLATRLFSSKKQKNLQDQLMLLLPSSIRIVESNDKGETLDSLDEAERQRAGQQLLVLYFAQFHCSQGFFLDLGLDVFRWDSSTQTLLWNPSSLWNTLDDSFRLGVWELYVGYYHDDKARFERSLRQLEMLSAEAKGEERDEVIETLYEHFGTGKQREVSFSREGFKASFAALFELFERQSIRLPSDFAFLGIYLYSLYNTLDTLGGSYDVRDAFFQAERLTLSQAA